MREKAGEDKGAGGNLACLADGAPLTADAAHVAFYVPGHIVRVPFMASTALLVRHHVWRRRDRTRTRQCAGKVLKKFPPVDLACA